MPLESPRRGPGGTAPWAACRARFEALHGRRSPLFWARAPGRVNLLGEHTDYNGGHVLPAAVERELRILFSPSTDRAIDLVSLEAGGGGRIDLGGPAPAPGRPGTWLDRVRGVADALRARGVAVGGLRGVVASTVPLGAGLSSSAALEVAAGMAMLAAAAAELDGIELARACQEAESAAAGVRCGVMDPLVSRMARRGGALLVNCRTLETRHVPLDGRAIAIVLADSGVRRELAASAYNERRAACEAVARKLGKAFLCEADPAEVRSAKGLAPTERARARHVLSEDRRVLGFVRAAERGDWARAGGLFLESHRSLRDDYEVSCPELDLLVELAAGVEGCLGARLTGAGFGGSTVSLVRTGAAGAFAEELARAYRARTGRDAALFITEPADGARVEPAGAGP